jgi:hypothetical protein
MVRVLPLVAPLGVKTIPFEIVPDALLTFDRCDGRRSSCRLPFEPALGKLVATWLLIGHYQPQGFTYGGIGDADGTRLAFSVANHCHAYRLLAVLARRGARVP